MAITISIIVSLLALLATFYQLHLQRVHNEKSLKPLGQITFNDHSRIITVQLYNNGLGPLIIDQLTFTKGDSIYSSIKDCLDLDPKTCMYLSMDDLAQRVVLPGSHLTVFEKDFRGEEDETQFDQIRVQLSPIMLKVSCRDIYDNKIILERSFKWFSRHILKPANN